MTSPAVPPSDPELKREAGVGPAEETSSGSTPASARAQTVSAGTAVSTTAPVAEALVPESRPGAAEAGRVPSLGSAASTGAGSTTGPSPDTFSVIKIVVAALGILAAALVWFPSLSAQDHAADISRVRLDKNLNDTSATGAPQQSVVAGWATVDFLELEATQLDEAHAAQRRQSSLLFIVVATGAGLVLVSAAEAISRRRREGEDEHDDE